MFDIYNEQGQLIGQEKRAVVHKLGLLHKAVYCFVFNPQGQLLVQQRSQHKKIGPGQWDLSVAEHLSPGEAPAPTQRPSNAQQQHQLQYPHVLNQRNQQPRCCRHPSLIPHHHQERTTKQQHSGGCRRSWASQQHLRMSPWGSPTCAAWSFLASTWTASLCRATS